MKRFFLGLTIGLIAGLILATTTVIYAADQIKLIVNGQEVQCDVPPQEINGRVLVPARFLAEALGAKVEWDGVNNAVIIKSNTVETGQLNPSTSGIIDSKEGVNVSNIQTYEKDGYTFVVEDGIEYYPAAWITSAINEKRYSLKFNPETKETYMTYNDDPGMNIFEAKTVLENIPYRVIEYRTYIQKEYYLNTILPLVK